MAELAKKPMSYSVLTTIRVSLSPSFTPSLPVSLCLLSFSLSFPSLYLIFYWWQKRKILTSQIQKDYKTWMNLEQRINKQKYIVPLYQTIRAAFTSTFSQGARCLSYNSSHKIKAKPLVCEVPCDMQPGWCQREKMFALPPGDSPCLWEEDKMHIQGTTMQRQTLIFITTTQTKCLEGVWRK